MKFDSFSAFLFMEGHGPYVWTCYAVFMVVLVGTALWSVKQRSTIIRQQRRALLRAEQHQQTADNAANNKTAKPGDSAVPAASFSRIHPS